jgi:hypothetical protein
MTAPNLNLEETRILAAALPDELRAALTPQIELIKWWMRCGPRARREFLADAKAADPALFAEIAEGTTT